MTPKSSSPRTENITTPSLPARPAARRRRRWSAEQKADYLAQFAASGATATEFCREQGLSATTFCGWCRREARQAAGRRGKFAKVYLENRAPSTAAGGVTIYCPGGISLAATPGLDPVWLGRLAQALR